MSSSLLESFIIDCRSGGFPCLIICAGRNSGKTTHFKSILASLQGEFSLTGIIAESTELKNRYIAKDINSGKTTVLMEESNRMNPGDFSYNRFIVHQTQFDSLTSRIIGSYQKQIIAIDEVGKIELEGRGWCQLLRFANEKPLLITVRDRFVKEVTDKLIGRRSKIFIDRCS